jgi:hypothetical protein
MVGRRPPWAAPDMALQRPSLGPSAGLAALVCTYTCTVQPCYRYLAWLPTRKKNCLLTVSSCLLLNHHHTPPPAQRRSPPPSAPTHHSTFSIGLKQPLVEHLPRKWKVGRKASLGRTGHRLCTRYTDTHVHLEPQGAHISQPPSCLGSFVLHTIHLHNLKQCAHTNAAPSLRCTQPKYPVKEKRQKTSSTYPNPPDAPTQTPSTR